MKRIPFILTFALLISIIGGYYLYQSVFNKSVVVLSKLIPANAALVYEANSWGEVQSRWGLSSLGKSISLIKINPHLGGVLENLDSSSRKNLELIVKEKPVFVSLHVISKDDFDLIYYFSVTPNDKKIITDVYERLRELGYNFSERFYEGVSISEVRKDNQFISYILYEDYLVVSTTAFLIEDVIRNINQTDYSSFFEVYNELTRLPRLHQDDGNLYINYSQLFKWLGVFAEDLKAFEGFRSFGKSGLVDVKFNSTSLTLDGFSVPRSKGADFLNLFDKQDINELGVKRYIPTRAAVVAHFSTSNMNAYGKELSRYLQETNPVLVDSIKVFSKKYDFSLSRFYDWVGDELALCNAELYGSKTQKIIYIKVKEVNEALNQFNSLADRASLAKGDSTFIDFFGDYHIREIGIENFPEKLLGPFFKGFSQTYYTLIGEYFVLSDNLDGIKLLIEDIESENTWGHSLPWNTFIGSALQESNISLFISSGRLWNIILPRLNTKWRDFVQSNQQSFLSLEKIAVQFNKVDDRYFTNVIILCNNQIAINAQSDNKFSSVRETIFSSDLIINPFVVKNHIDNSFEVLLQDSNNIFYLISAKGEMLWSLPLGSSIVGDVTQVDFYRNNKLQYFFTTSDGDIHVVDRLGRYVEGYPIKSGISNVKYVIVVDYDNSKRYRWLVSADNGDIYMFDKERNVLDGWKPNKTYERISSAARHFRARGRDFIVVVQELGSILMFNRRGEMLAGFPLKLDTRLGEDLYLYEGRDFANTFFSLVSKEGILIKFNLNGQVVSREQLYKPSRNTQFNMIREAQGKSFILLRQEGGRMALLDDQGKEIFQKDYMSNSPLKVQYYDFGSGRKVYTVTDVEQELSYIYDQNGKLINQQPFESSHLPTIIFSEVSGKFTVYNVVGKKLQILSF